MTCAQISKCSVNIKQFAYISIVYIATRTFISLFKISSVITPIPIDQVSVIAFIIAIIMPITALLIALTLGCRSTIYTEISKLNLAELVSPIAIIEVAIITFRASEYFAITSAVRSKCVWEWVIMYTYKAVF